MKTLTLLLGSVIASTIMLLAAPAMASTVGDLITGQVCTSSPNSAGCTDKQVLRDTNDPTRGYIYAFVNTFIFAAGMVATVFLVLGGIKYITSSGDPGRISAAKNTILYAIVGLIVAILARAITGLVIGGVG